ncbi:MAG: electron transport complex subunit RsxE [Acetatifactor sp.]|nr:electron transport complex subunit RsxE [Acetatifactor sp.]
MSTKKKADSPIERLGNGLFKENPTFVLMLGMCPTLAVTTSALNGLGMGLATTAVLMMSNLIISLLRKVIPNRVRIPAFIVIIATFVTVVQFLMEAYLPDVNAALGIYIPLIVVNCIILGRAEAYAYSNPPIASFFDGLGMGLGFSLALTCIGAVRELLGAGKIFDNVVMPSSFVPINIFVLAPGAFFVLAALTALQNYVRIRMKKAGKKTHEGMGCNEDCMNCADQSCSKRFYDDKAEPKEKNAKKEEAKEVKKEEPKAKDVKEPKTKEIKKEESKVKDVRKEEPKVNDARKEEPKAEEEKTAEPKAEEVKPIEPKVEEVKPVEPKAEEEKTVESKTEEGKPDEPKTEDVKTEEDKSEEGKKEEPKPEQTKRQELTFEEIKREALSGEMKEEKQPVQEKTIRQIKEEALRKRLQEKERKGEKKDE